jgi:prepilin-type N-terminal cleavage/methylation domain-containing protein
MLAKVGTRSGFTLVEVAVVLAIVGIVVGAIYSVFVSQQKSFVAQEHAVDVQQHARVAMALLTRECRMAGYNPLRVPGIGMVTAEANRVGFTMDIRGGTGNASDGDTNDLNENITYQLADGTGDGQNDLLRNGRAVVSNVDAFDLEYLDADGNPITRPVSAANLPAIRSIQISILVGSGREDRDYTDTSSYSNQQGQVIFTAPGDHHRRRLLSTEVKCRNLWSSV